MQVGVRQFKRCTFCTFQALRKRGLSSASIDQRQRIENTGSPRRNDLSRSREFTISWVPGESHFHRRPAQGEGRRSYDNNSRFGSGHGFGTFPRQGQLSEENNAKRWIHRGFRTSENGVRKLVLYTFDRLVRRLKTKECQSEILSWGVKTEEDLKSWAENYREELSELFASENSHMDRVWNALRQAYMRSGQQGLLKQLKYRFSSFVLNSNLTATDINKQKNLADLRYPAEWYPATRALQRTVHLHVGPTNSGKTYHALKRLEAANSGLYAGPLRLLAHEVYTRLNAQGKPCALVTGDERRFPENYNPRNGTQMVSCTVEMMPVNVDVDVAVIDEIQMLGDEDRGWAWTQAFLGVKAKELHLCGELRTMPLIRDFCRLTGDKLVIHEYKRLSPLKVMKKGLDSLQKLEKGDCVIVFTRLGLHSMKKQIELVTKKRCAIVYGSLPPETRAQQAALFNDPDNDYDFLVASDAVGMGLNLSIKRVVFETTSKHDGVDFGPLPAPALKQIGGRAGRFRTVNDATKMQELDGKISASLDLLPNNPSSVGLVTTLHSADLPSVKAAMDVELAPLTSAGLYPSNAVIIKFARYFPNSTPLSYILLRVAELATMHSRFHLCRWKDQLAIADCIQTYNLTITDRLIFIAAPINFRDAGSIEITQAFAKCVADQSGGELLDIPEVNVELLDAEESADKEYLKSLEFLHKTITLYLWLSYRFAGVFRSQALAFHIRSLVEAKIDRVLNQISMTHKTRRTLDRASASQTTQDLPSQGSPPSMLSTETLN